MTDATMAIRDLLDGSVAVDAPTRQWRINRVQLPVKPMLAEVLGPATSQAKLPLSATFQRVSCVSLDRRTDRWQRFQENIADVGWPFATVERFSAIDGKKVGTPPWWKQGGGAWGCFSSHMAIIQDSINRGIESVLLLEDDALFPPGFPERAQALFDAIPSDWECVYLGGQHLGRPRTAVPGVVVPHNVNRTHCWGLRGAGLKIVYRHLLDFADHLKHPRHHIDHRLGVLHERDGIKVYAASPWIVGQAGSVRSNINGKIFEQDRFWNSARKPTVPQTTSFVAVIGLHRSGSSCLAGVLHNLGLHLGNKFTGYEANGGFEAAGLATICEQAYRFPSISPTGDMAKAEGKLRNWIAAKRREAKAKGTIAAGKYPHLCAMGDVLIRAAGPGLKILHIQRDIDASIRSLQDRGQKYTGWLHTTPEQAESVQRWLWDQKEQLLAKVSSADQLTVEYTALLARPQEQIQRIVAWMGITPTEQQVQGAGAYVQPDLNKHGTPAPAEAAAPIGA